MMLLPEYIKGRFNEDYTFLVFGVLLIVIMIFMPGGLTSAGQSAGRAWRRLRGSGRPQPKEAAEEIAEGSARTGSLP
jgi:Sec-independent protein translocase protein TatA